jgi:hypothetical protein
MCRIRTATAAQILTAPLTDSDATSIFSARLVAVRRRDKEYQCNSVFVPDYPAVVGVKH